MPLDYTTCPIRFSRHAQEQADERGATLEELETAIRLGVAEPAKKNRLKARYTFPFQAEWYGKHYAVK